MQTVSRTDEVHIIIKFVPSTPDIACFVFSKFYVVVIFYRRPVHKMLVCKVLKDEILPIISTYSTYYKTYYFIVLD